MKDMETQKTEMLMLLSQLSFCVINHLRLEIHQN
jgi:hypothetical protein